MVELLTMSTHAALLAIDDEPDVLAIVAQFAQRFGFTVVTEPTLEPHSQNCADSAGRGAHRSHDARHQRP